MDAQTERRNIGVHETTRNSLRELGAEDQTYDDIIQGLISEHQRMPAFVAEVVKTVLQHVVAAWDDVEDELEAICKELDIRKIEADTCNKVGKLFAERAVEQMRQGAYGVVLDSKEVQIGDGQAQDQTED